MNEFKSVLNEVRKVINGKDREIIITMLALLANGNILIEDIPGVGKTTMALAFSKALGLKYGRIQFTRSSLTKLSIISNAEVRQNTVHSRYSAVRHNGIFFF